jgi:hypothetical protein
MKFADVKIGQRFKFAFESSSRWTYIKDSESLYTEIDRPSVSTIFGNPGQTWNINNGLMGSENVVLVKE